MRPVPPRRRLYGPRFGQSGTLSRTARAQGARPHRFGVAWWIERDGCVWLVRRPATGLLGGMAALPGSDWGGVRSAEHAIGTVRHLFTHFALDLAVERREPVGEGWWHPIDALDQAGLPTLYRRAADLALDRRVEALAGA